MQLCGFDLKTPTLTERVSVIFVFPGHLSADGLRLSLSRLLEVHMRCAQSREYSFMLDVKSSLVCRNILCCVED